MRKRVKQKEAELRVQDQAILDETPAMRAAVDAAYSPRDSPAHAPTLAHYAHTLDGHFWFRSAYEQFLDALPTDRPTQWVEIGVFQGQSTAWLGVEIVNRGLPVTLHAVDTFDGWDGTPRGAALRALFDRNIAPVADALGERFRVHAMSSVEAAGRFADGSLDVVWIDADHSYEAVRADIAAWLPKVKAGGVIAGDDWAMGGVAKAVEEAFPGRFTLGEGSRLGTPWPWWCVRVAG